MKNRTPKTIQIALLAVLATLFVVSCAQPGLSEQQRLDQFISDANANPQDYVQLRDNFSAQVSEYDSMNTQNWWNDSYFNAGEQPFAVTNESLGGAHPDFSGSTTISGTISNGVPSSASVTFVFVSNPDSSIRDGNLIRAIIITDGATTLDDIRSIVGSESSDDATVRWELR